MNRRTEEGGIKNKMRNETDRKGAKVGRRSPLSGKTSRTRDTTVNNKRETENNQCKEEEREGGMWGREERHEKNRNLERSQ